MSRSGEPGAGEPVRVMLLTSSLEAGGAERQVIELAKALVSSRFDPLVCSLSPEVPLAASLHERERRLVVVPKRWRFDVTTIPRVARVMRRERIRLVQSFLFDADMVARLAAPWGGAAAVIASERNSDYERPRLQSIFLKLTRRYVDALVANSRAGQRFTMRTLGMPESDVYVIHNGVDVQRFHPRDRVEARLALRLPAEGRVVGMVASFKPQKNHLLFLEVARRVVDRVPDVLFVCAGEVLRGAGTSAFSLRAGTGAHRNVDDYHRRVGQAIEEHRLGDKVRLLGAVDAVERVYDACDLTLLTSLHEGTPNVLLESMASGVPVVATAVSDNAEIVPEGRVGHVVPSGDAAAMADRVVALLTDDARREAMSRAAREWVEREFSTSALARKTGAVYDAVLRRKAPGAPGVR
jgi:glycosyltransferase involved in cell wall biosynthesis